jgi:hypothetical protein
VRHFPYAIFCAFLLWWPSAASSNYITSAEQLSSFKDLTFNWPTAKSKSLKILLEYRDSADNWHRVSLGSGFVVSADGLFVTAYHVMKYCLQAQRDTSGLGVRVDCSTAHPRLRYIAINDGQEFEIQIVSYLNEADSTKGKESHAPDEIIKQRDFVIGKLKTDRSNPFSYWNLRDFDEGSIDVNNPRAEFQLTPLMPPRRVFIVGFPNDHDFVISEGFLNLTERKRRGYFAADLNVYTTAYLESQGVAIDTKWGLRVENHMSGGVVVDASGFVIGLVVNGNRNTAGVLSIENVLSTFFSRENFTGASPSILLQPTETPLYLRRQTQ